MGASSWPGVKMVDRLGHFFSNASGKLQELETVPPIRGWPGKPGRHCRIDCLRLEASFLQEEGASSREPRMMLGVSYNRQWRSYPPKIPSATKTGGNLHHITTHNVAMRHGVKKVGILTP